jgi:hypothetical protein
MTLVLLSSYPATEHCVIEHTDTVIAPMMATISATETESDCEKHSLKLISTANTDLEEWI